MDKYAAAAAYADRIEQELKRIGYWNPGQLPPEAFESNVAFFGDTMPFAYWVQFVLLTRIRQIVGEHGQFPAQSQVGAQAVREFDGAHEASELVSLLSEFDAFIEGR
jgi:uncharacterized protein YqcC (DUF446 family)